MECPSVWDEVSHWIDAHGEIANVDTLMAWVTYRQQVLKFSLSSMALENEPVNPERLAALLQGSRE